MAPSAARSCGGNQYSMIGSAGSLNSIDGKETVCPGRTFRVLDHPLLISPNTPDSLAANLFRHWRYSSDGRAEHFSSEIMPARTSMSDPMGFRPKANAATRVVPLPQNGSEMLSPILENVEIAVSA